MHEASVPSNVVAFRQRLSSFPRRPLAGPDEVATPIKTSCSGCTIPGLTTAELRQRARDNFYTAERHAGTDPATAYDRAEAFADDLERIYRNMQRAAAAIMESSR